MSSTESKEARELAAALFDEQVQPLAQARRDAGQQSFYRLHGDPSVASYFQSPVRRTMTAADFEFPGGGTPAGLADALAAWWSREGNTELAAMAPALKAIGEALAERTDDGDDTISPLIYTMF
jgi:hypothetical protein